MTLSWKRWWNHIQTTRLCFADSLWEVLLWPEGIAQANPKVSNHSSMTGEVADTFCVSWESSHWKGLFTTLSINILCDSCTFQFHSFIGREVSRAVPFPQRHNYYPDLTWHRTGKAYLNSFTHLLPAAFYKWFSSHYIHPLLLVNHAHEGLQVATARRNIRSFPNAESLKYFGLSTWDPSKVPDIQES